MDADDNWAAHINRPIWEYSEEGPPKSSKREGVTSRTVIAITPLTLLGIGLFLGAFQLSRILKALSKLDPERLAETLGEAAVGSAGGLLGAVTQSPLRVLSPLTGLTELLS